jgi:hypothetical protein
MEFVPYPKTPRLKRDTVITEKLDGTNAQVVIHPYDPDDANDTTLVAVHPELKLSMRVGSRSRWITPGKTTDNYGFAQWCLENQNELFKLGEGQHFGEWYGQGIQRGYGLDHRRFALFNTARWGAHNPNTPACCETVPVLYTGHMTEVDAVMKDLVAGGSVAVPGFMKPEGVIVYHSVSKQVYKVLVENDDKHKGEGA